MEHTAEFKSDKKGIDFDLHYDGRIFKGPDQVGALCRELTTGTLKIIRDNKHVMTVDVEKRAKLALRDGKKETRMGAYQPFERWF